ncbi:hypothetical protein [Paenibacillus lutrae]|uniref:Uncharacterized protein n=1 Tax=Paenibacillus lutrae TaxID=2078573 RepID=A0A7X3K1C7_9BACL|nr:hypothetical protein [Paenibacillus lutrae]MVP01836.1 hypothetical protein [Paenibacillus lutrae]
MPKTEINPEEIHELTDIIKNSVSMELRVENTSVEETVKRMTKYGFVFKNSWASMKLPEHTVIEFWKKELIKL